MSYKNDMTVKSYLDRRTEILTGKMDEPSRLRNEIHYIFFQFCLEHIDKHHKHMCLCHYKFSASINSVWCGTSIMTLY